MLSFTCRNTSKISVWLTEFFFFRSAYGQGGGTLGLTSSLFADCSSFDGSTTVGADLVGVGTAGLSSLPLLKVTTALTSSILAFGSLAEPISCTPLGFCCVWGRKFPFFRTLLLARQPGNGTLQLIMHDVYLLVE